MGQFGVCADDPRPGGAEAASVVRYRRGAVYHRMSRTKYPYSKSMDYED